MFSLSSVDDPIRDALNTQVRHFSTLVGWATLIVAIGVALEGVEIVHDIIVWTKRKRREKRERSALREVASIFPAGEVRGDKESHSDHPRWVKRVLRLGLIAVVVGVVGEWRCGAKLEDSHNAIHIYDVAKLTAADEKAGNAAKSAKTAQDEVGAVKKEARDITKRLTIASRQLTEMEHQLYVQGPRWKILEDRKKEFIEALKPFARQKLTVVQCGNPAPKTEEYRLANDIVTFLGPSGAGWITAPNVWKQCSGPLFFSNLVMTAHAPNGSILGAEGALIDVLNNKLGIATGEFPDFPTSFWQTYAGGALLTPGSPLTLALNDPTQMVLFLASNPMVDVLREQQGTNGKKQSVKKRSH